MAKSNSIEKLRGRENFDTWKISAQSYLTINGYWSCTKAVPGESASEGILEKHEKALSELTLMIEPSLYSYIQGKVNAKEAWDALNAAFSDTGTCRKVFLLQQWISTKLSDSSSMEDYVNKMTGLWTKVKAVGFTIDEEVAASVLLAGLPAEYKPMILGMENSKEKLSIDYIKNLLLQGAIVEDSNVSSALIAKGKKKVRKVKCYNCGGPHFANKCPKKKMDKKSEDHALFTSLLASNSQDKWQIDSGCTAHMTRSRAKMQKIRDGEGKEVICANNQKIKVNCVGDVTQQVYTENGQNSILMKNVQFVPDLCVNLMSVAQIVKNFNTVLFTINGCFIKNKEGRTIATGSFVNDTFILNTVENTAYAAKTSDDTVLWHKRMGHVSLSNMHFLKSYGDIQTSMNLNCVTCAEGKHSKTPFKNSGTRATDFLEIVHSDVCGKMSVNSIGGAGYFVTFIDDFSRKIVIYAIKNKSQVFDCFVKYKNYAENLLDKRIKTLRTDNGSEYCNHKFNQICESNGIVHQKSCVYTPQQNGLSERYNRTIVERARCLLFDSSLPRNFWAEAVATAVRLINSTPNTVTREVPDVLWYKKPIDYKRSRSTTIFSKFSAVKQWCINLVRNAPNSIKNQRNAFLSDTRTLKKVIAYLIHKPKR